MLEFHPQCCDAVQYLQLGEACYRAGDCYHDLRPVGDQLWFSLPFRLGLPPESLIVMHWALWLLSVGLSSFALAEWVHRALPVTHRVRWLTLALMLPSALVHGIVFYPVMFVSLADAPAGLLLLSAIWLLLLSYRFPHAMLYALAGLALGAALWLRLSYYYPVLLALGLYYGIWIFRRSRQWRQLLLLLALLPALMQSGMTYQHYGEFSFIKADEARFWREFHLNSAITGYDTIWPGHPFRWGMPCLLGYGISTAWERREPLSIICLLKERVGFFFGSYSAQTYPFYGEPNLLNEEVSERIGDPAAWQTQGLLWQPDVMLSPYDTHTADGLVMQPAFSEYRFWQRQTLQGGDSRYTYSLWLWADAVPSATLELVRDADDAVVGRKTVTVHAYPERHHAVGVPEQSGVYRLQVRWDAPTSATNERPVMYAWGAKLEANNQMSGYRAPADQHILRVWSEPLYWWSFIAFWMSAGLLVALRAQMHAGVWASITLVGLIVAESLVVTPEQRFGVVFMTVFWLCPFALLQLWFERYWWRWRAT